MRNVSKQSLILFAFHHFAALFSGAESTERAYSCEDSATLAASLCIIPFLIHLQECAGQRLYELYWAIKQQMEKGPQDAITLEARYSLSEEKLLRASFDFHELTVFIAADQRSSGAMEYPVRVLDCDTITQVNSTLIPTINSNSQH